MRFLPALTLGASVAAALPAAAQRSAPVDTARLTLPEVATAALHAHPAMGAARATREEAEAVVGETRAALWPRLSVDASATHFQESMIVAPLHSIDPASFPRFDETLLQASASLGYTLFDGGARGGRIRGARSLATASEADVAVVEQSVIAEVARAYLRVLAGQGVLAAASRRLEALAAERGRAARFVEEGRAARVDLLRVEAVLARARADSVVDGLALDLAERELARLAGLEPDATRAERLVVHRVAGDAVELQRDTLVAQAFSSNPEVIGARSAQAAAAAAVRVARAAWFPELRLGAAYHEYASGTGASQGEWQAGVRLAYPIFTGGGRGSAVDRADAQHRAAVERVRLAELRVREGVDRAASAWTSARARVAALEVAVEQSAEVVRIERLALDAGSGVQTDYLLAEAALFEARAGLIEARQAEVAARVELARATGELSLEWLRRNLEVAP